MSRAWPPLVMGTVRAVLHPPRVGVNGGVWTPEDSAV